MRHLLELGSVAECLDELRRLPRASSRCYTIVDKQTAVQVESSCDRIAVLDRSPLIHTNHYLDHELAAEDRSHVFRRRESRRRLTRVTDELRFGTPAATDRAPLDFFALLTLHDEPAICTHAEGNPVPSQ